MSRLLMLMILFALCPFDGAFAGDDGPQSGTVVVKIDKSRSGFVRTVNSRVPAHGLFNELLDIRRRGANRAAIVVQEDVTLKMLSELDGLLSKAGFVSTRVFYFSKERGYLFELAYPAVFLYSENVDSLVAAPQPATKLP